MSKAFLRFFLTKYDSLKHLWRTFLQSHKSFDLFDCWRFSMHPPPPIWIFFLEILNSEHLASTKPRFNSSPLALGLSSSFLKNKQSLISDTRACSVISSSIWIASYTINMISRDLIFLSLHPKNIKVKNIHHKSIQVTT